MSESTSTAATPSTGLAPVPPGYTSLTPFLCVADGAAAIDFYCAAFGASVVSRLDSPGGGVAHAELQFAAGRLQLGDAADQYGLIAPSPVDQAADDRTTHSVCLYLPDVDAVTSRAVELGAILREAPTTFVTGDRYASILDPFGHRWAILTRVEEVSPEEQERRLAAWAADQPG